MIKKKELLFALEAMAILVGTVIGGGIFVLPYMNIKSGIVMTNVWLLFLCVMVCLLHLIFGEIILKTKEEMKLPGYAGKYLGDKFKRFLNFVVVFSLSFSLLIYIVLANKFFQIIFADHLGYFKPVTFLLI
jgi:amino acid permease